MSFNEVEFIGDGFSRVPVEITDRNHNLSAAFIDPENVELLSEKWASRDYRGVYVLLSPRLEDGSYQFYVGMVGVASEEGKGGTFLNRMRNHVKEKSFWTQGVLVARSHEENSVAHSAEGMLDVILSVSNPVGRTNLVKPGNHTASQSTRETAQFFVDFMLQLLRLQNYPVKIVNPQPVKYARECKYPDGLPEELKRGYEILWNWREDVKEKENLPDSGKVLSNAGLRGLLITKPVSFSELMSSSGVIPSKEDILSRNYSSLRLALNKVIVLTTSTDTSK